MQSSTAAILQAGNLYMYVMHNPVRFVDPSGLAAIIPNSNLSKMMGMLSMKARAATATMTSELHEIVEGGSDGFLTPDEIAVGITTVTINGNLYRDVTNRLNYLMGRTIREGLQHGFASRLMWFYGQMNHSAPWDIKEPGSWNLTVGGSKDINIFPGNDALVFFYDRLFCLPSLGNFTYGYIGRGAGFTLQMLQGGSAFAAATGHFSSSILFPGMPEVRPELRGQHYTQMGYFFHQNTHDSDRRITRMFPRR